MQLSSSIHQHILRLSAMLMAYLPATLRGDDFCLLSGNRSAYDARIELIDLAQHEIAIAYYASIPVTLR